MGVSFSLGNGPSTRDRPRALRALRAIPRSGQSVYSGRGTPATVLVVRGLEPGERPPEDELLRPLRDRALEGEPLARAVALHAARERQERVVDPGVAPDDRAHVAQSRQRALHEVEVVAQEQPADGVLEPAPRAAGADLLEGARQVEARARELPVEHV